jgi:hypothetical protein
MTDNFFNAVYSTQAMPEEKSRCKFKNRPRAIEGKLAFSGAAPDPMEYLNILPPWEGRNTEV